MSIYQQLYDFTAAALPDDWAWVTIYCAYGEGRTRIRVNYGTTEDRQDYENIPAPNISQFLETLRSQVAPPPTEQFTHIELTFERSGNYNSVLGYGKPNWDVMPISWPDDITAEEYTYVGAWPNGITAARAKRLKDPRSSKGVAIIPSD